MHRPGVLVVEDEDLHRWALRERLADGGHRVLEAGTGREAIAVFEDPTTGRIGFVLLDLRLPDMDGLQVLAHVKTNDRACAVVVMTASPPPDLVRACRELGALSVLDKPFPLDDVLTIADSVLTA